MNEEVDLSGISDADIRAYLLDMGIDPDKALSDSDKATITQSKTTAQQTGNSKLINTVNTILGFINTEIGVLSKNGIIGKQQLSSTYPTLGNLAGSSSTDTTNTDNAPDTSNRVFNIDFTSPTTLIIVFGVVVLLFYFLFFKPKSKNGKR
ncbi:MULTISPECIES: hypothetical protein [Spirosoma]|uniref:hypothetical protein n=1 Tax=Spirosoma TaxID=107 RepID=UPI0009598D96|nr:MULTISPECIES: hypothetical protein [Spirosoma]MBN8823888.1 hypothetical protein [Spirosoma sp.]OJW79720.1 MAG: hypothetical protein BGO59_00255 [Spirosoma sp. 48-14]